MQAQDIHFRVFRVIHSVGPAEYYLCFGDVKMVPRYNSELKVLGGHARLLVAKQVTRFTRAVFSFKPQFDMFMNYESRPVRCVELTKEEQDAFWAGFIEVDQKSEAA